jgi:hypothetical protein
MNEVVVTGATGFIGVQVVRHLAERGHRVVGVTRDPDRARQRGPSAVARWVRLGTEQMKDAIRGAGRVVNLAGEHPFAARWSGATKAKIHESRVGLTAAVAAALHESTIPGKVIVNAAGTPIWGDRGDAIIEDDTPPNESGFLPTMIREWTRAAEASGARCASLRIGLAFGAQGFGPFQVLAPQFRRYMGGHPGTGRQFMPWLHVDDCARMFVTALEDERWRGGFVCASPNPVRAVELASEIGRVLNRPSWLHPPRFLVRLMLGEASCLLLDSQRAIPKRALSLGFEFRYPFLREALQAVVAETRRAAGPVTASA